MQLHEGVVVGRKTCVDALLGERVATCVEMGCLLSGSSSKCLALRSESFLAVQTEVNQFLDPTLEGRKKLVFFFGLGLVG